MSDRRFADFTGDADDVLGELTPEASTHGFDTRGTVAEAAGEAQPRVITTAWRWLLTSRYGRALLIGWPVACVHVGLVAQSIVPGLEHPVPVLGTWQVNLLAVLVWFGGYWVLPFLRHLDLRQGTVRLERTTQFWMRLEPRLLILLGVSGLLIVVGPGALPGALVLWATSGMSSVWGWVGVIRLALLLGLSGRTLTNGIENTSNLV